MEERRPGKREAEKRSHPHRRDLLKLAATVPLLPLLGSCGEGDARLGGEDRILVVGGGIAGLRALDLLVAAGREAGLLEAGSRLGGRVLTLREESGFVRGLRAEAGAERIGNNQRRINALMIELGLATEPYAPRQHPEVLHWEGRRYLMRRREDAPELLAELAPGERAGFPDQIHVVLATAAPAPAPDDPRSGLGWLRDLGMSRTGEALVRAFCPYPLDVVPAAAVAALVRREVEMLQAGGGATIRGGSDLLVHRLQARHAGRIRSGCRVHAVDQDGEGVVLRSRSGGGEELHRCATAIFCIPAAGLAHIRFAADGVVPAELQRRLGDLTPVDELKVHLQVPASVFGDSGLSDYTRRARFPRVTWRLPEESPDGQIVLNALALREDLPALRASLAAQPSELGALLRDRMPRVAPQATHVRSVDLGFSDERPEGGWAFAVARSAEARRGSPIRLGRVVVAGGDLSPEPGWMEGALASAEGAVREVLGR
jgi:monoamine oxidase